MEFDPPSALTRFGMFFLAGGVALIFALWGVLKWLDSSHQPTHPQGAPTAKPQASKSR